MTPFNLKIIIHALWNKENMLEAASNCNWSPISSKNEGEKSLKRALGVIKEEDMQSSSVPTCCLDQI